MEKSALENAQKALVKLDVTNKQDLIVELAQWTCEAIDLQNRLHKSYVVGDLGSGGAGISRWKFDSNLSLVSIVGELVGIDRDDSKSPLEYVMELKKALALFENEDNIFLYCTSWARKPSNYEKELLRLLQQLATEYSNIQVVILSQREESEIGNWSLKNILKCKHANNLHMKDVVSENTLQLEGGKGSIQSFVALPEQTAEKAGLWITEQLQAGEAVSNIIEELTTELNHDFQDFVGYRYVAMHGVLAIALQNITLERKDFNQDDWIRGQLPCTLDSVQKALEDKVKTIRQSKTLVPFLLTFATLEAFRLKYGTDFDILNMRAGTLLADGSFARMSGSHGTAVKHFSQLQEKYDQCVDRIANIIAL